MKTLVTRTAAVATLALATTLGHLQAQPQTNDYITVALDGSIQRMNPRTGSASTLAKLTSGWANAVVMSPVSNNYLYILRDGDDALLGISPAGTISTTRDLPDSGQKCALIVDVDGSWVIANSDGTLYRVDRSRNLTTVATGLGPLNAMTLDGDTGDYMVGSDRYLFRVDRRTKRASTLAAMPSRINALAFQPSTGYFVVACSGTRSNLRLVDKQGRTRVVRDSSQENALFVDGRTGEIIIGGRGRIARLNPTLTTRAIHATSSYAPAGITIWRSLKVQGLTAPKRGTLFAINLRFADSPNAYYRGAIFTGGMRPGIRLSGRIINANVFDPLFLFSSRGYLEGLLTRNIDGYLNASGNATTYIQIPSMMPAGAKLYFVSNAVNRSKPGGLEFGNTIVIPVE